MRQAPNPKLQTSKKSGEDVAIRVEHVSKDFLLLQDKATTIKSLFTSFYKRRRKNREVLHALKDVSLEIKQGEFFGIVGRNGSGKSTLLKLLAGIYQPTKGSIQVNGKLVPFIELGVGFNPELTGRENVYLNGAMMGFTKKETDAMYDEIVEFAELKEFMDQKLKNYSSGMQVRLAFSVAIKAQADILLIDEVLAVGDADFQRKCYDYFRQLKYKKATVIFVSHDMNAVREYCDRAILIEKSRIVKRGSAERVTSEYNRLFINSPTEEKDDNNDSNRSGDGTIRYIDVLAPKKVIPSDESINITVRAKVSTSVENPNFGLAIQNATGEYLFGTNTKTLGKNLGKLEKNETITLLWNVPNILNDGKHFLTIAITGSTEVDQYDWWDRALSFTVHRDDRTPYPVNPQIEVRVSQ